MATLAAPAPGQERISQILPSVKCSNCNQPVAIADLGDHVCTSPPPLPAARLPASPKLTANLFQNIVAFPRSQPSPGPSQHPAPAREIKTSFGSSAASAPDRRSLKSAMSVPRARAPSTASSASSLGVRTGEHRARVPSTASSLSVRSGDERPERIPSPLAQQRTPEGAVRFPTRSDATRPDVEPPLPSPFDARMSRGASEMGRGAPPANYPPPPKSPGPRPRAPSSASARRSAMYHPNGVRQPVQSAPHVPPPSAGPVMQSFGPASPPLMRPRATTNVRPVDDDPDVIYSTGPKPAPPVQPLRPRAPSSASMRHPEQRPAPPPEQPSPMRARAPSNASMRPPPSGPPPLTPQPVRARAPSNASVRAPSVMARAPPDVPAPPMTPRIREEETRVGGTAGMAGVGRRGFAAAARAAMFTLPFPGLPDEYTSQPDMSPRQGMDGRRANAPRFLDIASASNYAPVHSAHTPPLSPHSANSPLSPHTPLSQKSPLSATIPSPRSAGHSTTPTPDPTPAIASPVSPRQSLYRAERVIPPAHEPPSMPLPSLPATPTTPALPFFEKFKNKLPEIDTAARPAPADLLASPSSGSDYGGLAYADSDADAEPEHTRGKRGSSSTSRPTSTTKDRVRFPSMASESRYSSSPTSPAAGLPKRSLSASTAARGPTKSTGALDRALETLFEDQSTPASSPFLVSAPLGPEQRESRAVKLPVRSHTSPTLHNSRDMGARAKKKRVRACVKCERVIEDGRWIQMDGGSVLCDRCWKNMYLPKCRRCNLTIEKQAVSSSDGQLKGKYHRACFNCHTCQQPFPDKSFYVLDGKPFCAYHYHEANNSLCAAASCGQPIEGPCAVSHAGQRYHPEHLLCEARGCAERLADYWEVDGRMLCERHAGEMGEVDEDEEDDLALEALRARVGEQVRESVSLRAMKRTTRFIDLAGLGGSELR